MSSFFKKGLAPAADAPMLVADSQPPCEGLPQPPTPLPWQGLAAPSTDSESWQGSPSEFSPFDDIMGLCGDPNTVPDLNVLEAQIAEKAAQASAQEPVSAAVAKLQQELGQGLNPRGNFGQQFARNADGGKNEAYKALGTQAEKRAFRLAWGNKRLEALLETKVKIEAITKEEREQGEYLPFDVIVDREWPGPSCCTYCSRPLHPQLHWHEE